MRMAADHLAADGLDHVIETEGAFLFGQLRVIDRLQQKIAQFLAKLGTGAARDGIGHLIGFLDRVGSDRIEILLEVPRTAGLRRAQRLHDSAESVELTLIEIGRIGHASIRIIYIMEYFCTPPKRK